jgi:hypothetical protein
MLRILTAGLAMLAASACTIGVPSAVEAAPFEARMASAPFADGVYCALERDADGGRVVKSADADGENNCASFAWEASRRAFVVTDSEGEKPPEDVAPADLGGGLFLLQFRVAETERSEKPFSFLFMAGMAQGEALAVLPLGFDEHTAAMAGRYPGIQLSTYQVASPFPPVPAEEGDIAEPAEVDTHKAFYISGGSPPDIRALVRDIALYSVGWSVREAREKSAPLADAVPTLVRDVAGAADHPPTQAQRDDIRRAMAKLQALAPSP